MMYLDETTSNSFKRTFGVPAERFCDKFISLATKKFHLDIIEFDEWLGRQDPEYDPDNCTYKGKKNYSVQMYVEEKYGKDANAILNILLK